jgi:hypothetical protein
MEEELFGDEIELAGTIFEKSRMDQFRIGISFALGSQTRMARR